MKVIKRKGTGFYIRAAKSFFKEKVIADCQPAVEAKAVELKVIGLGEAISVAIAVAMKLEAENIADISNQFETNLRVDLLPCWLFLCQLFGLMWTRCAWMLPPCAKLTHNIAAAAAAAAKKILARRRGEKKNQDFYENLENEKIARNIEKIDGNR